VCKKVHGRAEGLLYAVPKGINFSWKNTLRSDQEKLKMRGK